MKKTVSALIGLMFIVTSCDIADTPIELSATNEITKTVDVSSPATNGTAFAFDESLSINLSEVISDIGDITSVKINTLSFKFKDFTGNTAGVIQTISLKVNGEVLKAFTDLNVSQEATDATVFSITDSAKLAQLESILENDSTTTIQLAGSVLSDAGVMDFKIEVNINLTTTI